MCCHLHLPMSRAVEKAPVKPPAPAVVPKPAPPAPKADPKAAEAAAKAAATAEEAQAKAAGTAPKFTTGDGT